MFSNGGMTSILANQGSLRMTSVVARVLGSGSSILRMIERHSRGTRFESGAGVEEDEEYCWR